MKILDLIETDFVNYKKPCMTVMFPHCTFKCNKDAGRTVCHNYIFKDSNAVEMSCDEIVKRYLTNPLSEAIVMQGLEPFDSFDELYSLIYKFTEASKDDIVIYTGYNKEEIEDRIKDLCNIIESNKLIIKFGRFIPDDKPVFDEILQLTLQSSNQYAEVIKNA